MAAAEFVQRVLETHIGFSLNLGIASLLTIAGGIILGGIGLILLFALFGAWAESGFAGCLPILGLLVLATTLGVGLIVFDWLTPEQREGTAIVVAIGVVWALIAHHQEKSAWANFKADSAAKQLDSEGTAQTHEVAMDAAKLAFARRSAPQHEREQAPVKALQNRSLWLEEELPRWLARQVRKLRGQ